MADEEVLYEDYPEGYELEGAGAMDGVMENEAAVLFRNMEDELQMLVQRYKVPPTDLEQLFEVVQHMFELMDANQDALDIAHREKDELENLWKQEKDKLRIAQRKKLDIECRLEEQEMKNRMERIELEREKAILQTRVKQIEENKSNTEQEFQRLKQKITQDEKTRKDLLEQYKKQADFVKVASLKRKANSGTLKRRPVPIIAREGRNQLSASINLGYTSQHSSVSTKSDNFLESAEVPESPFPHDIEDEAASVPERLQRIISPLPSLPCSLAEELEKEEEKNSTGQLLNGKDGFFEDHFRTNGSESGMELGPSNAYTEDELLGEDDMYFEEMLGVDPLMRTEVEMLQKEKESWSVTQKQLEGEKRELRTRKESFERQNTQLQVDLKRLQETNKDILEKLSDVKKERDEILDNYLDQPFDEYCITRKELHELLVKHQRTAFELEKAKEEKKVLEKQLESRRTVFEKLRMRWKKLFTPHKASSSSSAVVASSEGKTKEVSSDVETQPPVVRDIASVLENGRFSIDKEWLVSTDTKVDSSKLPHWIGQILLKGVETERIECSCLARIFQSPFSSSLTPHATTPNQRLAILSSAQQLHAEVWTATVEASVTRIEIIDVIARPPKVRQRFVIKPKTSHVICMLSVPGIIEESNDFIDSAILTQETDWIDSSFTSPRRRASSSYLGPRLSLKGKDRPNSAPKRFLTKDLMSSTPNLSLSSASDPGPLNPSLGALNPSPDLRKRSKHLKKTAEQDNYSISSCSLTTIDEAVDGGGGGEWVRIEITEENATGQMSKSMLNGEDKFKEDTDTEKKDGGGDDQGGQRKGNLWTSTPVRPQSEYVGLNLSASAAQELVVSENNTDEVDYDCTDGRLSRQLPSRDNSPVMWMITEENDLLFFPTTDPSHKPINRARLKERALCMEYIQGMKDQHPRVFIGHSMSLISIYHMDEFQDNVWDIENPERISLPNPNPDEYHDVRTIACVADRIWVGAGPSIFFLNAEDPIMREGSIFLDGLRRKPEKILPLGEIVVVSTKGTIFYIFDSKSARALQKFDIGLITHHLDDPLPLNLGSDPPRSISAPTGIKSIVSDGDFLYLGTSNGKIVSVPLSSLTDLEEKAKEREAKEDNGIDDSLCISSCALALHSHMDHRVRALLCLKFPEQTLSNMKAAAEIMQYRSLPNLASPLGGRIPVSPPILSIRSMVISVGRGHVHYVDDQGKEDSKSVIHRERNEAFQFLIWGHKNALSN